MNSVCDQLWKRQGAAAARRGVVAKSFDYAWRTGLWVLPAGLVGIVLGTGINTGMAAQPTDPVPAVEKAVESTTFVGPTAGAPGAGKVAVVVGGGKFLAYTCGDETYNAALAVWFTGDCVDGKCDGKTANGAATIACETKDGKLTGTVKKGDVAATFTAAAADTSATLAGLYRAEEKTADGDTVTGWIIDADDAVVGATRNRQNGQVQTPPPGRAPAGQGLGNGVQAPGGTRGQQVRNPAAPPAGQKAKRFTPASLQEEQQEFTADVQAGNVTPLTAAVVNQVKRFQSTGGRAGSDLEQKTFAALRKVPGASLTDYMKNWDALPAAVRTAATGGVNLPTAQPLTADVVKSVVSPRLRSARRPGGNGAAAPAATGQPVSAVQFTQLRCINKTDGLGGDEVFATYLTAFAGTAFDKTTSVYLDMRNGATQTIRAADTGVFPPAGGPANTNAPLLISAGLFDDDSADKARVVNLVNALIDVAANVLTAAGQDQIAEFADDAKALFASIAASLPDTRFMNSDSLTITNRQANKQVLTIRKLANVGNRVKFHYEIRGLLIN